MILGVNIDHVATLREARYPGAHKAVRGGAGHEAMAEPDPVRAVHEAELGGAGCITMHLREDRRHVNDRDVELCRRLTRVKFNLEMAATEEMIALALAHRPHMCTLVPEGRQEVTTEGGLDVRGSLSRLREMVGRLKAGGIGVSAFIDPDARQIEASAEAGFDTCEVHTGPYATAWALVGGDLRQAELKKQVQRVLDAGVRIRAARMRLNVGHGLNYVNVAHIAAVPGVEEFHIGHAIVSRAVFVGLRRAVREMVSAIVRGASGPSAVAKAGASG